MRIIIVDKDFDELKETERYLRKLTNNILALQSGKEALEQLDEYQPDIFIVNSILSDMDGIEFSARLHGKKQMKTAAHCKIIIIANKATEDEVVMALSTGVHEFLRKPFGYFELMMRVRNIYSMLINERQLQSLNSKLENEKEMLKKYLSKDLLNQLFENNNKPEIGGARINGTVLFFDLRHSMKISQQLDPIELATLLSSLFSGITTLVHKYNGSINRMLGDGMLITFGCPEPYENAAFDAIQCASAIRNFLKGFSDKPEKLSAPLRGGIGIATGEVFAGNIGSESRMEFTVLGNTVNLAARLESLNKTLETEILTDVNTVNNYHDYFELKHFADQKINGIDEKIDIYSVL